MDEHSEPDNYINPKHLSRIEQTMLKEIFKRIENFQAKLNFDFTRTSISKVGFRCQSTEDR